MIRFEKAEPDNEQLMKELEVITYLVLNYDFFGEFYDFLVEYYGGDTQQALSHVKAMGTYEYPPDTLESTAYFSQVNFLEQIQSLKKTINDICAHKLPHIEYETFITLMRWDKFIRNYHKNTDNDGEYIATIQDLLHQLLHIFSIFLADEKSLGMLTTRIKMSPLPAKTPLIQNYSHHVLTNVQSIHTPTDTQKRNTSFEKIGTTILSMITSIQKNAD